MANGKREVSVAVGIAQAATRAIGSVPDAQRERVLARTDLETLSRWIRRALTLTRAEELFEE